jgi:hypothetical protein
MSNRTAVAGRGHEVMLRFSALLLVLLCVASAPGVVSTVAAQAQSAGDQWEVPKTSAGHPDFQGNFSNSTLTPFQRREGFGPVYTWEEVQAIEQPDGDCPANPGTVACGRTERYGSDQARLSGQEYNEVYWERGTAIAVINGQPRTSLVTYPANGRVPARTPEALALIEENRNFRSQFEQYDHPELRPFAERCILFGSPSGPPMIPVGAYNSNYAIVQTDEYLMIMSEMVHDARIIRIGKPNYMPKNVRPYFGNSWGRWDGDVLVVETTNLSVQQPIQGVIPSEDAKVIERFSWSDERTLLYEFTVVDPASFTEVWGGEIPIRKLDAQLYEYACHEGNYSLEGVLSGARYQESLEAQEASDARRD